MNIYKITIELARREETLTRREWTEGGSIERSEDSNWGYTPQVKKIETVNRKVLEFSVTDLNTSAVVRSILENSEPLADSEGDDDAG